MIDAEEQLLDALGLQARLDAMAASILDGRDSQSQICLIGVRTRGYPIAQRLAVLLKAKGAGETPVGAVDITLYRDDLHKTHRWPVLLGTQIPFDVDGADVVLVDDVLFTGRTTRAALNTICDMGRPSRVRLAVLIDRGFREIPIQADVIGLRVETKRSQRIRVRVEPLDPLDEVLKIG